MRASVCVVVRTRVCAVSEIRVTGTAGFVPQLIIISRTLKVFH